MRSGGDEQPRRLATAALEWSAQRIGAVVGGCALVNPRLESVSRAWVSATPDRVEEDARFATEVLRRLFPSSRPSALARRLDADLAQAAVVSLDQPRFVADGVAIERLIARRGLAMPLVVAMRARGRVAGALWLCCDDDAPAARSAAFPALRRAQPLLELAQEIAHLAGPLRTSTPGDLTARGLTRREYDVARLALGGRANAVIAAQLKISEPTVKNHLTRIFAKCGVRTRGQLIAHYGTDGGSER